MIWSDFLDLFLRMIWSEMIWKFQIIFHQKSASSLIFLIFFNLPPLSSATISSAISRQIAKSMAKNYFWKGPKRAFSNKILLNAGFGQFQCPSSAHQPWSVAFWLTPTAHSHAAQMAIDRQHHQTIKKWRGKCLPKVPNFNFDLKFARNPQISRKNGQIPKNWLDL